LVYSLGRIGIVLSIILDIFLFVAGIAVGIKRLHDRNKGGWWLLLFYVVPGMISAAQRVVDEEGGRSGIVLVLALASVAIPIWALIELGCLRGTAGPNQYAPDPLSGKSA
jgi:uncharacterized membrane protein YhaH (DUF805 family)